MLDLARVKEWLRVETDAEDATLNGLLAAAVAMVEKATGFLLSPKTLTEPVSVRRMAERGGIRLFKSPVNEVTGVTYLDGPDPDADTVTIDSFQLVEGGDARLLPGWGETWPSLDVGQVLTVTYSAGYAAGEIPDDLEQAVLSLVAHLYQHRDDAAAMPPVVEALIAPYRPIGIG